MKRMDFADAAKAVALYFVIVGHAVPFAGDFGTFVKKRAEKS
ncbi:MAG: hypothetical protein Q4A04_06315 [Eubacteriales bacterium]|nr:hypothetical protein [Eubacteriales bacterium]